MSALIRCQKVPPQTELLARQREPVLIPDSRMEEAEEHVAAFASRTDETRGEGGLELLGSLRRRLRIGRKALASLGELAPDNLRNADMAIQGGYQQLLATLAMTQFLQLPEVTERLVQPDSPNPPLAFEEVNGRFWIYGRKEWLKQLTPKPTPNGISWYEGDTLYVRVKDPACPTQTFSHTHQADFDGQPFKADDYAVLGPELKTSYAKG